MILAWFWLGFFLNLFYDFHFSLGYVIEPSCRGTSCSGWCVSISLTHCSSFMSFQLWQVECPEWSLIRLPLLIFSSLQLSSRKIVTSKSKQRGKCRVWETNHGLVASYGIYWDCSGIQCGSTIVWIRKGNQILANRRQIAHHICNLYIAAWCLRGRRRISESWVIPLSLVVLCSVVLLKRSDPEISGPPPELWNLYSSRQNS